MPIVQKRIPRRGKLMLNVKVRLKDMQMIVGKNISLAGFRGAVFFARGKALAWGIGVDRLAMCALNIKDIRELFSQDLGWIRKQKMVGL